MYIYAGSCCTIRLLSSPFPTGQIRTAKNITDAFLKLRLRLPVSYLLPFTVAFCYLFICLPLKPDKM